VVPVRFYEFADESEASAYAIADNKLSEIAEWDEEKLGEIFAELAQTDESLLRETGFDSGEIERLIAETSGGLVGEDPGPGEPPLNPVSRLGEVYELGPHRLMCGDSTNAEHVARLMNGERATLLSTDPPYCVDYTGMDRFTTANRAAKTGPMCIARSTSRTWASSWTRCSKRCCRTCSTTRRRTCGTRTCSSR
jgi:hypothetical protein